MKDWFPSHNQCMRAALAFVLAGVIVMAVKPVPAKAETLEVLLPYVIENHDRVRASKARLTAARNRARESLGAWFPTLGQTANAGHETQENDDGADTRTGFHEWDISLTQLLWDFGSTNAAIDKARLQVEEARYDLIETRQSLILEAITAYMNVIRSDAALKFAKDSEENIRRQTGLEEALVGLGSGFSTDVLQAKTQLAGAQARRAQSDGGLINALNRYQAVYGRMPNAIAELERVPYPAAFLPLSLTQATDIAFETNPSLKNAILAADIAVEDVRIARADNFTPTIEATAERKFKKNVGGTIGPKQETLAKVEMTFDFNLGFTAVNTLRASESDLSATTFTAADTRRNIEEQVRNAWQQLQTATQTASHLNNQANIAAAFLELARNERQLGRRSLIDVLSGETNLINAKSDAFSAETDVLIAAYGLLAATGQLEYDIIKNSRGVEAPRTQLPSSSPAAEMPEPAPTLPVTPATGQQNGEIEPDTAVASGRSVADLQAVFREIGSPDVAVISDTVITFGRSQSGDFLKRPNHPPKPKSRYQSFADFDAHSGTFPIIETVVASEFASRDISSSTALSIPLALPAETDTAVVSTPDTAEVAASSTAPYTAEVRAEDSTFSLEKLFSFLGTGHQTLIQDTSRKELNTSVTMSMPPKPGPVSEQPTEISDVTAPEPASDYVASSEIFGEDPISNIISNVFSFFESAQPVDSMADVAMALDDSNGYAEKTTEVAVLSPSVEPEIEPTRITDQADNQVFDPLLDLFTFLEAAHERSLEDADGGTIPATQSEPVSTQIASAQVATDNDEKIDTPSLFSLFSSLFDSGDIFEKIEYEPGSPDSFSSAEMN